MLHLHWRTHVIEPDTPSMISITFSHLYLLFSFDWTSRWVSNSIIGEYSCVNITKYVLIIQRSAPTFSDGQRNCKISLLKWSKLRNRILFRSSRLTANVKTTFVFIVKWIYTIVIEQFYEHWTASSAPVMVFYRKRRSAWL